MLAKNNTILKNSDNKIIEPWIIPAIEFDNIYSDFPAYISSGKRHPTGSFEFTSSISNTIYIDYGDGEQRELDFITSVDVNRTSYLLKTYPTAERRRIKIRFKHPGKIQSVRIALCTFHGDFPKAFAYMSLKNLDINSYTRFNNDIFDFPAVYYDGLSLNIVFNTSTKEIPVWLSKSRIKFLRLGNAFNLTSTSIENINTISKIKDLTELSISASINELPNTLKNISTLRTLAFGGGNYIKEIRLEIRDCKQIKRLFFGYLHASNMEGFAITGQQEYGNFNSWGVGIGGMLNLEVLKIEYCESTPTSLPEGIDSCPNLTDIILCGNYTTVARIDEFINTAYQQIVTNNILKTVNLNIAKFWGVNAEPSGVYQAPNGFIKGVNNGTPATPKEKIYVIVNNYGWTVKIMEGTVIKTYTP